MTIEERAIKKLTPIFEGQFSRKLTKQEIRVMVLTAHITGEKYQKHQKKTNHELLTEIDKLEKKLPITHKEGKK